MSYAPVAIVIPALNEERVLSRLAANLRRLDRRPAEILLVDGGSGDRTAELAKRFGFRMLCSHAGRGIQINAGVAAASSPIVCVLHADTLLPRDAVHVIQRTMVEQHIALASFTPLFRGRRNIRWLTTLHSWLKTWYAPMLFRPHLFLRGARLLFGDHAMFFRRSDFLAVGGCDPDAKIMEDAELCISLNRLGRVRLVNRFVVTSDRRIEQWGELRANWIVMKIGVRWALGRRHDLHRNYPSVR